MTKAGTLPLDTEIHRNEFVDMLLSQDVRMAFAAWPNGAACKLLRVVLL